MLPLSYVLVQSGASLMLFVIGVSDFDDTIGDPVIQAGILFGLAVIGYYSAVLYTVFRKSRRTRTAASHHQGFPFNARWVMKVPESLPQPPEDKATGHQARYFKPLNGRAMVPRYADTQRQGIAMRRRNAVFMIAGIGLSFAGGYFVRGLNPELACKTNGGWYSEAVRECMYVEPSEAALRDAQRNAVNHLKRGSTSGS